MAAVSNAFDALSTKPKKTKVSANTDDQQLQNEIQIAITEPVSLDTPNNDDTSWIVQSSTKRRLAPQYVLSKNDLGVDSPKNKASQQELIKKKVLRFTKEEILALRVETKVLASLVELADIVAVTSLLPVTSFPFDFEDFNRIWNADRSNNIQKDGGRGRGRGRGRPGDENGDSTDNGQVASGSSSSGGHNQWNRGNNREDDMWDSSNDMASNAAPQGFDLSDFAAAALQFRNQTKELINNEKNGVVGGSNGDLSYGDQKQQEDDAMARLLEEQLSLDGLGNQEEEEDIPDWAKDDGEPVVADTKIISADSKLKRNLLLETLNVKVSSGSNQTPASQVEAIDVIADTAVILPKSAGPDTSSLQTPFSFQFDDNRNANTGTNTTTNVTSNAISDIGGNGFSQPLTFSKSPTHSLESTYLSTVNLSDVLGKLLIPPPANTIDSLGVFPNNTPSTMSQLPPSQPVIQTPQGFDEWEYLDPQNEVQGPFASKNMRRWLEIGYFKMDLPIRLRSWSRFYPLGRLYPNLEFAFQQLLPEPGTADFQASNNDAVELQRRQQQAAIEQKKMQQLNMEQRQQLILEQRQQQALVEQQRQQQAAILEQRQQQALFEQRQQQSQLEQRHQQALLEQRQQALLEQRQQQVLLEQRQQQAVQQSQLEQRQQQAQLEQRQQQALFEQRQQQALLEQRQQQALLEQRQQQANLDHQRQQALIEQQKHSEQQRYQQALLEQQQRQQRQMAEATSKGSPWNTASSNTHKSLAEIQIEEELKQQQAMQHHVTMQQTQSSKLKSFLGMASGTVDGGSGVKGWGSNDSPADTSNSPAFKTSSKSLKEIQQEEQQELLKQQQLLQQQQQQYQKRLKQQQQQDEELAAAKVLPLSWNNPSTTSGTKTSSASANQPSKTSLKDIMKEEIKSEPVRDPAAVVTANSWASKAKSGAPAPAPAPQLPNNTVQQQSSPRSNVSQQVSDRKSINERPVTNSNDFNTAHPVATTSSTTSTKLLNKSEFGGKGMSQEFAEFCVTSMQRLNGNDDITLLQFCMSLKSPAEIREYLAAYLGSKPEVSQFATEYIKRRETGGSTGSSGTATSSAVVQGNSADKKILKKKK